MTYTIGQHVEARTAEDQLWRAAIVIEVDQDDTRLPQRVEFSPGDRDWVRPGNIRPLAQTGPRLQYRTRIGHGIHSRFTEWESLNADMTVNIGGAWALETREQPHRSDAEIVAKLREYTDQQLAAGIECDENFANILGGSF